MYGWYFLLNEKIDITIKNTKDAVLVSQNKKLVLVESDNADVLIGRYSPKINYVSLMVIPSLRAPRWYVPYKPGCLRKIGKIIKPSSFASKMIWYVAKALDYFHFGRFIFSDFVTINLSVLNKFHNKAFLPLVYTGAPGLYQKYTIQIMDLDYLPIKYIKIAASDSAKKRIIDEKKALLMLPREISRKNFQYPELLYCDENDYTKIEISAAPKKYNIVQFSLKAMHICVLKEMQNSTMKTKEFLLPINVVKSRDFFINDNYLQYKTLFLEKDLYGCLSHGDFSPWNILFSGDDVFIYDWELCAFRPILWDYFNFILHACILTKRNDSFAIWCQLQKKYFDMASCLLEVHPSHQREEMYFVYLYINVYELIMYYSGYRDEMQMKGFLVDYKTIKLIDTLKEVAELIKNGRFL